MRCQIKIVRARICMVILVFLVIANLALAEEVVNKWRPKHPFSGEIVEFNKYNTHLMRESSLLFGKTGLRIETAAIPGQSPPIVYLQNFSADQSWMLTPMGERYVVLQETTDNEELGGGLMSTKPCMGQTAKQVDKRKWRGLNVKVWQCLVGNKPVNVQYFSRKLEMVIRDEQEDGQVKEIRNIRLLESQVEDFSPPKGYREVSLRELFTGAPGLPVYQE